MAILRTRTLLTGSAIAVLMASGSAFAQDATIYYETPIIQHGQPVANPTPVITPVPVYTPVPVAAQAGASAPVTPATVDDLSYLGVPQVQTDSSTGASFVSGGIGASEKAWFDSHTSDFNLKASYNDTTGHNLAGVNVTLSDSKGNNVMNTVTEGPYLLVKAKPGTYTLTSNYEGQTKTTKVTLGKGTARTNVTFTDTNPDM